MKKLSIFLILLFLVGCISQPYLQGDENNMEIIINHHKYEVKLYQNETVKALLKKLPMTLTMTELNGNEKYVYLDDQLPTNEQAIQTIHKGDLMLFGDHCLVLFYKDFQTHFQYTPIGRIKEVNDLKQNLGEENIKIEIL